MLMSRHRRRVAEWTEPVRPSMFCASSLIKAIHVAIRPAAVVNAREPSSSAYRGAFTARGCTIRSFHARVKTHDAQRHGDHASVLVDDHEVHRSQGTIPILATESKSIATSRFSGTRNGVDDPPGMIALIFLLFGTPPPTS